MKVAFYEKDITPPLGGYLAGYYTNYVADDVLDSLYVHAAVISNDETTVAIIAMDSCEFPDDMHDAVTKRITEYTGIKSENVMITVNHTHKGMPIFDSPEINAYADGAYKDVVYRLIADCVTLAYRRLEKTNICFGCGSVNDISVNRTYIMKDGTIRTNQWHNEDRIGTLAGIDPELPVLYFKNAHGKPQGAIISFACHNDCVYGSAAYTGGFSSVLSRELKKEYGENFVTVLFAGASGDINHLNPAMEFIPDDWYIHMGKRLAEETVNAMNDATAVIGDTLTSCKELFTLPKRKVDRSEVMENIAGLAAENSLMSIRNMAYYVTCNKSDVANVYLQCIRIGDVLLYGYPGEIFVNFGIDLKKHSPFEKNIVATLCNGGCGYVATREAFAEKSLLYEKTLCFDACLDKEAGYMMNEKLIEMAKQL